MRALLIDTVREGVERRWAIACGAIVELLPVVRWRELPDEPAWLLGVFERQRRLLPLVDLSVRLGGSPGQRRLGTRIVVVRLAPERADGGLGGLLANGAIGIDTIDWTTVGAHSGMACALNSPFGPIAPHGGTTVQLLHPERLLSFEERGRLFPDPTASMSFEPVPELDATGELSERLGRADEAESAA
jgi:chemotaxis signal transduction protein